MHEAAGCALVALQLRLLCLLLCTLLRLLQLCRHLLFLPLYILSMLLCYSLLLLLTLRSCCAALRDDRGTTVSILRLPHPRRAAASPTKPSVHAPWAAGIHATPAATRTTAQQRTAPTQPCRCFRVRHVCITHNWPQLHPSLTLTPKHTHLFLPSTPSFSTTIQDPLILIPQPCLCPILVTRFILIFTAPCQ